MYITTMINVSSYFPRLSKYMIFLTSLAKISLLSYMFKMLYATTVFWCALLHFLAHPKEVFGYKPNSRRGCKDNREELGFALVGHDFKSVHADNFARCYFKCSLEERCQSITFLWKEKECQMKKETKKSRPEDFVENPAAIYMENNFRGLSFQLFLVFKKRTRLDGGLTFSHLTINMRPITMYLTCPVSSSP